MKSWKTTVGGVLGALGTGLQQADNEWAKLAGTLLTGLGLLLMGSSARDNKVSSEEAGATK